MGREEAPRRVGGGALGAAAASSALAEQGPLSLRRAARALLGCAPRTAALLGRHRVRQPRDNIGRTVAFADSTCTQVYRETVVRRRPPDLPAVLIVSFRLRWVKSEWAHAAFRVESELNTVLFVGFPGLVSKLWLRHDQHGIYRGIYDWDGADEAVAYVRALWWVLALVSERASIHYAVLPGLNRDDVMATPDLLDTIATAPGGWWRPLADGASDW